MKTEKPNNITEALNRVYSNEDSELDSELVKMQVLSVEKNSLRVPGIDKGKIIIQPDFDEPLEEFER